MHTLFEKDNPIIGYRYIKKFDSSQAKILKHISKVLIYFIKKKKKDYHF